MIRRSAAWSELERRFKGAVITADSEEYDSVRRIWNKDADKNPLFIVRPRDVEDVAAAVRFGCEEGLPTAVRCGGHSYQGHSTCDDGLVIDLSAAMGQVSMDPATGLVHAQGGALLGTVDRRTVPSGRVLPAGVVSHTGLGGLALGGGIGYLTRSFGTTCDQFERLRVVTASQDVLYASETENPDLFWALKGGGGNFGIVTDFVCRTHELGPIQAGPLIYLMDDAPDVISELGDLMKTAPREMNLTFSLGVDPTQDRFRGLLPDLAPGQRVLVVFVMYRGGPDDEILRAVRSRGKQLVDMVGPGDFLQIQTRTDIISQHGVGWYMKSGHTRELSRTLIEQLVQSANDYYQVRAPDVEREAWVIQSMGGAASDVAEEATAYSGRAAQWHCAIEVGFMTAEERARIVAWTKEAWAQTVPHLDMRTSYVNLNFEEGADALDSVYGSEKLARLKAVKRQYDPDNFFKLNTNIPPAEMPPV